MTLKSGNLGTLDIPAADDTVLYTCGSDAGSTAVAATATVAFCNRADDTATVRLAVSAADAPTDAEWIEFDVALPAAGVLERTGVVLAAGERLVVRSDIAGVSARAMGFEK